MDELYHMNALLEISIFMETDLDRLDEEFSIAALGKSASSLMAKAGLHVQKHDGLVQQAMKGGTILAKFVWYAIKAATGDKDAKVKVKEMANSEVKKEDVLSFLLNLDMATLHVFTGPIHFIDAVTGWHLWANVKEKAGKGFEKAKKALDNLIDVAKSTEQKIASKLTSHVHGIARLLGLESSLKAS
jgi:hypothetical protein